MVVREITLSPAGQKGYAIFLENPQNKSSMVYAFTEEYVKYVLPRQNAMIAQQYGLEYKPPSDGNLLMIVQWVHAVYLAQGWSDRQPRMVELVNSFFDVKVNETDISRALIEVKKRYNITFGAILDPPYPELVPILRLPLPASPFI